MNQTQLIDHVAANSDVPRALANKAIRAIAKAIKQELANSGTVTLAGVGKFKPERRAARYGRHPQTGATIRIAASVVVKFKASDELKGAINL